MARVGTILGTMEMGRGPCVDSMPSKLVNAFLDSPLGSRHLDTAFMYCGGETEKVLGEIPAWKTRGTLATKVNPWDGKGLGSASVRSQLTTSLSRLQVSSVDLVYLHAPDHNTPLDETLQTVNELHKEGKFREFGLSNFSSWLVAEVVNKCKNNGWIQPTVYQGMYSAVTRQVEAELIPCLRHYGLKFYAYSPLGGGILTGKYKFEQQEEKSIKIGRFNGVGWDKEEKMWNRWKIYRDRYWKPEHFEAMTKLQELLKEHQNEEVTVAEAAFRWIYNHSMLDAQKGDAVILGCSRLEQLEMNLQLSQKGELAKPVVEFFDDWWNSTKHLCPNYFR